MALPHFIERTATGASAGAEADVDQTGYRPADEDHPDDDGRRDGPQLGELRRLSGLTRDQLARLFGMSRRALLLWASGKAMSADDREHLQRLLVKVLGAGNARRVPTRRPSAKAMAERMPPPPETLVGALHDRIHPASGRLLATKPVSVRRDD